MPDLSRELKLDRDLELEGFIETFQLSSTDSEVLKNAIRDPLVRDQVHQIWHYLELRGDEGRLEVKAQLKLLSHNLQFPAAE